MANEIDQIINLWFAFQQLLYYKNSPFVYLRQALHRSPQTLELVLPVQSTMF